MPSDYKLLLSLFLYWWAPEYSFGSLSALKKQPDFVCHWPFKTTDFFCGGKQETESFIFQSVLTIQSMSGMETAQ